jgi:hypothetical protein
VSSDSPTRYFTPEEANALLPELSRRIREVTDRVQRARSLAEGTARVEGGESAVRAHLQQLQQDVDELVMAIQADGVHVKGTDPGLLDFPALRHGHEVYLCWREGEDRVEHWHPLHTGIAGRQSVDYGDLGAWEWCN